MTLHTRGACPGRPNTYLGVVVAVVPLVIGIRLLVVRQVRPVRVVLEDQLHFAAGADQQAVDLNLRGAQGLWVRERPRGRVVGEGEAQGEGYSRGKSKWGTRQGLELVVAPAKHRGKGKGNMYDPGEWGSEVRGVALL